MIVSKLKSVIGSTLEKLSLPGAEIHIEHPENIKNGDFTSNVALKHCGAFGMGANEFAEKIKDNLDFSAIPELEKVEIAGPGFLNFYIKDEYFRAECAELYKEKIPGRGHSMEGQTALFEYTDPNPFKAFHIGHLMANAVGETLSRLCEFQGAHIKRICYQGDIGLHVAKTIWAMQKARAGFPHDDDSIADKIKFMGDAYVVGAHAYEDDETAKSEIRAINKKLFEKSDADLEVYYKKGKEWSLLYFDKIYKKLDTRFDEFIFESEVVDLAKEIVTENLGFLFEESEGAVVFPGERFGLHTRVFLNSEGLPTYEAKELALFFTKSERHKFDLSVITSANEISDYFKVLRRVMFLLHPDEAKKTKFIGHGMLRFSDGKMSSRKGNIITGEELLLEMEEKALKKMEERDMTPEKKKEVAEKIAVSAIKFSILRQSPGKDIVFDREKSMSFDGDSGPYLLYAGVRVASLLKKAAAEGIVPIYIGGERKVLFLEKLLCRFGAVAHRAFEEKSPNLLVEYLLRLTSEFNNFYAHNKIIDKDDKETAHRLALAHLFGRVLEQGLFLLGINIPEEM